jgi:hypothetical protein
MAVETPQLNVPIYQPKDMAQAPPASQSVVSPPQVLPAQAGFVPKSGAAAFVASSILDGWMRGREHAQQQALVKAQNQVQGADYTYATMAKNYNDLLKEGKQENDPQVMKAKQAAAEAWQSKLNVMQQYAMPEGGKDGKKSKKEKTEGIFSHIFGKSGITPEMIPEASIAILRNAPPPGLGLSPEDKRNMAQTETAQAQTGLVKTEAQAAELRLTQEVQKQADDKKMQSIVQKPEDQRTLAENDWLRGWQRVQHINDPAEKKFADSIMDKIQSGKVLNDTERNFAYSQRLLSAPQMTMHTAANGMDQMVMTSPDGKVLSTTNLGHHYVPDQVGPAIRLAQAQQKILYGLYNQATPEDPNESPEQRTHRIWGLVAADQTRNPYIQASFLTQNPAQKEQDMDMVNRALRTVWTQAGGPGASKEDRDAARAQMSNFVYPGDSDDPSNAGLFVFRAQVADPSGKKGWWFGDKENEYAGGIVGEQKLRTQQAALVNQVRSVLQQQNRKLTPAQIDRMIPPWLSGQGSPQQMSAPPGGSVQMMSATPGGEEVYGSPGAGKKKYNVTANGTTSVAYMTPEDAKEYAGYGAQVSEIQ